MRKMLKIVKESSGTWPNIHSTRDLKIEDIKNEYFM